MSLTANTQSFLFLMGSLNDAAVLDAAIESQHLEFQKLGVLTYLGRLEESPDDLCNRLTQESGVNCEIHWMRLPYPSEHKLESAPVAEEPVELEAPACFIVNH
jgi:hypothetical protein